jgi:hypothetical protein
MTHSIQQRPHHEGTKNTKEHQERNLTGRPGLKNSSPMLLRQFVTRRLIAAKADFFIFDHRNLPQKSFLPAPGCFGRSLYAFFVLLRVLLAFVVRNEIFS